LLPALTSMVQVQRAAGDGYCFVHSALISTGQETSGRRARACMRSAKRHIQEFVARSSGAAEQQDDRDDLQASPTCPAVEHLLLFVSP